MIVLNISTIKTKFIQHRIDMNTIGIRPLDWNQFKNIAEFCLRNPVNSIHIIPHYISRGV